MVGAAVKESSVVGNKDKAAFAGKIFADKLSCFRVKILSYKFVEMDREDT